VLCVFRLVFPRPGYDPDSDFHEGVSRTGRVYKICVCCGFCTVCVVCFSDGFPPAGNLIHHQTKNSKRQFADVGLCVSNYFLKDVVLKLFFRTYSQILF